MQTVKPAAYISHSKLRISFLSVAFVIFLMFPTVYQLAGGKEIYISTENRVLSKMPYLSSDPRVLIRYPENLVKYYADHFGMRDVMMHAWNSLMVRMHIASTQNVVIGRDGWLYYTNDFANDAFLGAYPVSAARLALLQQYVDRTAEIFRRAGAKMYLIVPPDKETIYPEYLPGQIASLDTSIQLRHAMQNFSGTPGLVCVDLLGPLLTARVQRQIYYQTDSHWNSYGAYVAYETIIIAMRQDFPQLTPFNVDEERIEAVSTHGMDLAMLLGFPELPDAGYDLHETRSVGLISSEEVSEQIIHLTTTQANGLTLFFIHDSFGTALLPNMIENFTHVYYIDSVTAAQAYLEQAYPDAVLWEVAERYFVLSPRE